MSLSTIYRRERRRYRRRRIIRLARRLGLGGSNAEVYRRAMKGTKRLAKIMPQLGVTATEAATALRHMGQALKQARIHTCAGCQQPITTAQCILISDPSGTRYWHAICRQRHLAAVQHDHPFSKLAEDCRAAMAMQGQPTGFRRVDHSAVDEWCDDENPFTDPNPTDPKASPPCPNCGSRTETSPDYGIISWPDDIIPTHVKDAMARGETPFACTACGHCWCAPWD